MAYREAPKNTASANQSPTQRATTQYTSPLSVASKALSAVSDVVAAQTKDKVVEQRRLRAVADAEAKRQARIKAADEKAMFARRAKNTEDMLYDSANRDMNEHMSNTKRDYVMNPEGIRADYREFMEELYGGDAYKDNPARTQLAVTKHLGVINSMENIAHNNVIEQETRDQVSSSKFEIDESSEYISVMANESLRKGDLNGALDLIQDEITNSLGSILNRVSPSGIPVFSQGEKADITENAYNAGYSQLFLGSTIRPSTTDAILEDTRLRVLDGSYNMRYFDLDTGLPNDEVNINEVAPTFQAKAQLAGVIDRELTRRSQVSSGVMAAQKLAVEQDFNELLLGIESNARGSIVSHNRIQIDTDTYRSWNPRTGQHETQRLHGTEAVEKIIYDPEDKYSFGPDDKIDKTDPRWQKKLRNTHLELGAIASEAKAKQLMAKGTVSFVEYPINTDDYSRKVVEFLITEPDGNVFSLGPKLIELGYADYYEEFGVTPRMKAANLRAREEHLGIYGSNLIRDIGALSGEQREALTRDTVDKNFSSSLMHSGTVASNSDIFRSLEQRSTPRPPQLDPEKYKDIPGGAELLKNHALALKDKARTQHASHVVKVSTSAQISQERNLLKNQTYSDGSGRTDEDKADIDKAFDDAIVANHKSLVKGSRGHILSMYPEYQSQADAIEFADPDNPTEEEYSVVSNLNRKITELIKRHAGNDLTGIALTNTDDLENIRQTMVQPWSESYGMNLKSAILSAVNKHDPHFTPEGLRDLTDTLGLLPGFKDQTYLTAFLSPRIPATAFEIFAPGNQTAINTSNTTTISILNSEGAPVLSSIGTIIKRDADLYFKTNVESHLIRDKYVGKELQVQKEAFRTLVEQNAMLAGASSEHQVKSAIKSSDEDLFGSRFHFLPSGVKGFIPAEEFESLPKEHKAFFTDRIGEVRDLMAKDPVILNQLTFHDSSVSNAELQQIMRYSTTAIRPNPATGKAEVVLLHDNISNWPVYIKDPETGATAPVTFTLEDFFNRYQGYSPIAQDSDAELWYTEEQGVRPYVGRVTEALPVFKSLNKVVNIQSTPTIEQMEIINKRIEDERSLMFRSGRAAFNISDVILDLVGLQYISPEERDQEDIRPGAERVGAIVPKRSN